MTRPLWYTFVVAIAATTGFFWYANSVAPVWVFKLLGVAGILVTMSLVLLTTPLLRGLDRILRLIIGEK